MSAGLDAWMPPTGAGPLENGEQEEINGFFNLLEENPVLFHLLQILWLRSMFSARLGREFAGAYGEGEVAPVHRAAVALYRVARLKALQVKPTGQRTLPLIEGLIRFQRVTYSFLPNGQPALFFPGKRIITYRQLRRGRTPNQTINYILRRIRGAG